MKQLDRWFTQQIKRHPAAWQAAATVVFILGVLLMARSVLGL